ncbi:hypothetical protein [Arthrobacter sp. zg-Y1110]|uniref:hypothetical protein n=1 Tax=Arthrobacter sp. zg-Y1110 TaxID=2886932 RepID=UPI001D15326F|nr:hypothetical protein [Arthrobacter sp. zg-Y1110]MCC3291688.1 hypothetical protein [Arthrobacter sp. zg-Y1110]UWX85531.1 hypothetical protein N2K99_02940 [Arthrobacter sp. zg-Y1110]
MNRLTLAVGSIALALALTVAGCATPFDSEDTMKSENSQAADQSRPASELLARMLELSDETTKVHGGQWTYSNDARSAWDGTKTSGYIADTCTRLKPGSGEKRAYRYSSMIMGPAVEDPEAAMDKYVSHFEQQGFTETNRYDSPVPKSLGPGYYIMVTLQDEEGSTLVYQAGTHLSSLSYEGPCSYDPEMEFRTT